jgi:hypothetical protein
VSLPLLVIIIIITVITEGPVLRTLFLNIFINDLCQIINHFVFLLLKTSKSIEQLIGLLSLYFCIQTLIVYINGVL